MFKVLMLQAMRALSDERTEFLITGRLSSMRFLRLGLADPLAGANTIWTFREALERAGAIDAMFWRFDQALRTEGFLAMSGHIVDATIVARRLSNATRPRRRRRSRKAASWTAGRTSPPSR